MAKMGVDVVLEKIGPTYSNIRRNSTGSLGIESSEAKALPHYLLASTGSCHDFCKYGAKPDLQTKARSSMLKMVSTVGKPLQPAETADMQKKKKSSGTTKPPLDSITRRINQFPMKEFQSSSKKVISSTHPTQSKPLPLKVKTSSSSTVQQSRRRFSDIIIPKRSADSEMNRLGGTENRRNSLTKLNNYPGRTMLSKKAIMTPPSLKAPSKNVLKNQKSLSKAKTTQGGDENVSEKTLYVIESKSESQVAGTVQGTSCISGGAIASTPELMDGDETGSSVEPTGNTTEKQDADSTEENIWVRRDGTDNDTSLRKLKFRRGKVIDVKLEKNSPRKLKFRQAKVLTENRDSNTDATDQTLTKVEVDCHLNGETNENIKVNLRHQAAEGKKGSQILYNNMIEETASKLVQTKKSKVKALVGAFETVISLQDFKYSQASRR